MLPRVYLRNGVQALAGCDLDKILTAALNKLLSLHQP